MNHGNTLQNQLTELANKHQEAMKDREMLTVDEEQIRQEVIEFTKIVRKTVVESGEVVQ